MRIIVMLSALAIALTACEDPSPLARTPNGTQALNIPSGGLLPGETGGCTGVVCGLGKDSVNE